MNEHEICYQQLKANGAVGWGGDSFEVRMQGWQRTLDWARAHESFPRVPARILDVGCGAGDSAIFLARLGYEVCGVDISPTAIDWASRKFERANLFGDFRTGDISQSLPWPESSFDMLLDSATLHCILKEGRANAFKEIARVLKPNGVFLVSSMVGEPKARKMGEAHLSLEYFDSQTRIQKVKGLPERYIPKLKDLKKEIISHGFEIYLESTQENPWWDHYTAICRVGLKAKS